VRIWEGLFRINSVLCANEVKSVQSVGPVFRLSELNMINCYSLIECF